MRTIWKFDVEMHDSFSIHLLPDAEVLSVQMQHGTPKLWVLTEPHAILPDAPTVLRKFFLHGTGHQVHPDAGRFIGTFQMAAGALVFHLFEERR